MCNEIRDYYETGSQSFAITEATETLLNDIEVKQLHEIKMTKNTQLTIRINSDLKAQAQQHAVNTGRTLAGLIDWLLKKELKNSLIVENQKEEVMKTLNELKEEIKDGCKPNVEV